MIKKITSNTTLFIKCIVVCGMLVLSLHARNVNLGIGIYDFTDEVSKEFYTITFNAKLSFEFLERSGLSLGLSSGISFTSVIYNDDDHDFLLVPTFLYGKYCHKPEKIRIHPFAGLGFGLYWKMDYNDWFKQPHYGLTYGYVALGGIQIPVNNFLHVILEIDYHIHIPVSMEELNASGIQTTVGVGYTFTKRR